MSENIENSQQELSNALRRLACSQLKYARIKRASIWNIIGLFVGGSVIYALLRFVEMGKHLGASTKYAAFINGSIGWILLIALFTTLTIIAYLGLRYYRFHFIETEKNTINCIIQNLFPNATCQLETMPFSIAVLSQSNLFGLLDEEQFRATSFGQVDFKREGQIIAGYDIAIEKGGGKSTPKDALNVATPNFRGLFMCVEHNKTINGSVIIIPNNWDEKMEGWALNMLSSENDAQLKAVDIDDLDFEWHFRVYATDEATARSIFTPAIMECMMGLKSRVDREMMMSFRENRVYCALSMPEGFLSVSRKQGEDAQTLRDFQSTALAVRSILNELEKQ